MYYYKTNEQIKVGDHVHYAHQHGVIVFIIDDDAYSEQYSKKDWSFLHNGLGIEMRGTLYHFDKPDEDLEVCKCTAA